MRAVSSDRSLRSGTTTTLSPGASRRGRGRPRLSAASLMLATSAAGQGQRHAETSPNLRGGRRPLAAGEPEVEGAEHLPE